MTYISIDMIKDNKQSARELLKSLESINDGCMYVFCDRIRWAFYVEKGKLVYEQKCQTCHAANGEGQMNIDGISYTYPPLWGKNSYNVGAGLFRLSRFAGYVKNNMPQGTDYHSPQLSDEEAWDVAAFVNSQPRPSKDLSSDWPDISKKPIDHPFGPYADSFSEQQHKYGPFTPIKEYREQQKKSNTKK